MVEADLIAEAQQAHILLQRIAASISTDTSGPVAVEALEDVLAAVRAGELATCRLVERVDRSGEYSADGSASTMAYLRHLFGEPDSWCSARVHVGRALADRMPETAAAWQRGELGLSHASVIRGATSRLEEGLAADIEKVLAEAAPHITPRQLSELAQVVKAAAVPEDAEAAARQARDAQTLFISKTLNGMVRVDGWLDTESGAIVAAAIEAFTRKREPGVSAYEDPIGRRRAEALVQIARNATAHAQSCNGEGGSQHTMVVATSLETLQSGIGTAEIQGRGPITAGAARRLACDAGLIPAVLSADSEILDLGKLRRLPSAALRRTLALRDGGCRFPGRDRPPAETEVHHDIHWADGGLTTEENTRLFCTFHHHLVHEGGWTYKIIDKDTLRFYPPNGGPIRESKRRPLIRQDDLNQQLKPNPTVRTHIHRRT